MGDVIDPTDSFATPWVAAGALFLDGRGRVLLVHPTYKATWEVPGGMVERGESPAAACRRELQEELGLTREPLGLLSIDWAPDEERGDRLLFLFDVGPLGDDESRIVLADGELDRWEWVHLDEVGGFVADRLARRIRSTAGGRGPYLEHGLLREP